MCLPKQILFVAQSLKDLFTYDISIVVITIPIGPTRAKQPQGGSIIWQRAMNAWYRNITCKYNFEMFFFFVRLGFSDETQPTDINGFFCFNFFTRFSLTMLTAAFGRVWILVIEIIMIGILSGLFFNRNLFYLTIILLINMDKTKSNTTNRCDATITSTTSL